LSSHPISRRKFLKRTFAFSASATLAAQVGCGWTTAVSGYQEKFTSPSPANVLMVGDWGVDGDLVEQRSVATAMESFVQQHSISPDALMMLGDNFYGSMPGGANSRRWKSQFEEMYPQTAFGCPAYAVLGNHDYQYAPGLKCDYQLEYAARGTSRFTLPSNWYRLTLPATNPVLTVLALDSNVPGVPTWGPSYTTMTDDVWGQEMAWLEAELQKPRETPFLAVMAHHPIYSNGLCGDHPVLMKEWSPLFREYKVDLYLAGHDHDMQHLELEGHPTSFFLSGGGGAALAPLKISESKRGPYAQDVYGFSHLHCTADLLTARHLDRTGSLLHKFTRDTKGNVTILYPAMAPA
jgi:hypothetical protein